MRRQSEEKGEWKESKSRSQVNREKGESEKREGLSWERG